MDVLVRSQLLHPRNIQILVCFGECRHTVDMKKKEPVPVLSGRGQNSKDSARQKALGDLLFDARKERNWSRADLEEATGVNASSIAKYENAGKTADGQYPKAPILAKLCLALNVDPLQVMLACLPPQDFGMYEKVSDYQYRTPGFSWLEEQLKTALLDATFLRSCLREVLPLLSQKALTDHQRWFVENAENIMERHADFEARTAQLGLVSLPTIDLHMPSSVSDDEQLSWVFNLSEKGVMNEHQNYFVSRSLNYYAERFTALAQQFGEVKIESPEDDLPSPPSSHDDEN